MSINELLKKSNMTKYRLSKLSEVPYATISDICLGKTDILKCSSETVYRIAKNLNISMEELISPLLAKRPAFELFKSNVCHKLKDYGDIDFLIDELQKDNIRSYYNKQWYPECFYLLAMVDYLSRINNIPLCEQYSDIRGLKLQTLLFPSSILSLYAATKEESVKLQALENAIPEFRRFNIVESEIRNVN